MLVPSFFLEINVCLVSDNQLVTAIARIDGRRVYLVAIAEVDAMEAAANHYCDRVGGTVGKSAVKHTLLMGVYQSSCDVSPKTGTVVTCQSRGRY